MQHIVLIFNIFLTIILYVYLIINNKKDISLFFYIERIFYIYNIMIVRLYNSLTLLLNPDVKQ